MKNRLISALILILCAVSCTKVEELNSDTSLSSFEVLSHSPQTIELGETKISADTIYIPIEYGKYNFPLTISAQARAAAGAYIYGMADGATITFDSINAAAYRFVLSAESGVSKNYFIVPYELPLDEDVTLYDHVTFKSDSISPILNGSMIAGDGANERLIVAIDTIYPLIVTPTFATVPTSQITSYRRSDSDNWDTFVNGSRELTFDNDSTRYELEIVAESGKRTTWSIGSSIIDYSPITPTLQIEYKEIAATLSQADLTIDRYDIDFESGEITIVIEESDSTSAEFPLSATIDVPTKEWLSIIGCNDSLRYTFNSWDDEFTFTLLYTERMEAAKWSVKIAKVEPAAAAPITVTAAATSNFKCGESYWNKHLTESGSKSTPTVYNNDRLINIYYSKYYTPSIFSVDWWCEYTLTVTLSNGQTANIPLKWKTSGKASEINSKVNEKLTIDIPTSDSTSQKWSVALVKDNVAASSECEIKSLDIVRTRPNYVEFEEPAYTIDQPSSTIYFNIGARYNFPMSIDAAFKISPYASIESKVLYFENELSADTIKVYAQDETVKSYIFKLITPQESSAPGIDSIFFGELSDGVEVIGEPQIDTVNYKVTIGVETTAAHFPLTLPIDSVVIENGGYSDQLPGDITFISPDANTSLWVNSEDGAIRTLWSFELRYYEQIVGGDMNSWEMDANPVTSSHPWSTPNMSGIAAVKNTTPVAGRSGEDGDYAAQMQTGKTFGQLASGSIFTGWFDKANSTTLGLSDPVRLTYFGTPFNADAKIKGITADVIYTQADQQVDWGSLTVILISYDGANKYEFHGNRPTDYKDTSKGYIAHPNNTATAVATSKVIFGNGEAATTAYGDPIDHNVVAGEWNEVFVPISSDQPFTHISVAAASSAYGDYFIGKEGSVMKIDNIRIVYE